MLGTFYFVAKEGLIRSWGSSVSIVFLDDWGLIPGTGKVYFPQVSVSRPAEAHLASYPMGTRCPFPGCKALPGRDADHSPPFSAQAKNV
jgi:hypothetical protein